MTHKMLSWFIWRLGLVLAAALTVLLASRCGPALDQRYSDFSIMCLEEMHSQRYCEAAERKMAGTPK